jgi:hypothetical protein
VHENECPPIGRPQVERMGIGTLKALDVAGFKNANGVVYDVKSFLDLKIVDGRL